MKAHYRIKGNRITFEVEGGTQKELFKEIAQLEDVFGADDKCGKCESDKIRFNVRKPGSNEYYELTCTNCHARLQFGQHKQGETLYPKLRDENGEELSHRGWSHYTPKKETDPSW